MKILQVFNRYLEKGGEEIWVHEFEKLAQQDHDVANLFFASDAWREGSLFQRCKQARLMWNNPASRTELKNFAATHDPDALIFHNILPVGSFGLYQEAQTLGLPVLQYTHNYRPFSPSGTLWVDGRVQDQALEGSMWREVVDGAWGGSRIKTALMACYMKMFIESGMIKQVTHWLAISEFMRDQFIRAGIPKNRISTLRHCRAIPEKMEKTDDQAYYLFLGRLVEEKGCLLLMEAWKLLRAELGHKCPRLLIAGTGPCEAKMKELAGESNEIEFLGFVSGREKQEILAGCRALLAPSIWWEPLGLIAYDGYEYGKPVLAARSGGLIEVVEEAEGGFLHEPGNARELAGQISKVEQMTGKERQEIGMRGRSWLSKQGSPEVWRERLSMILESCC